MDRLAIDTQELATTLSVPLGKPVLVGGLTYIAPSSLALTPAAAAGSSASATVDHRNSSTVSDTAVALSRWCRARDSIPGSRKRPQLTMATVSSVWIAKGPNGACCSTSGRFFVFLRIFWTPIDDGIEVAGHGKLRAAGRPLAC